MKRRSPAAALALGGVALVAGCGDQQETLLANQLGGGEAVSFQHVRESDAYICGEARPRVAGAGEPYRRFVHDRSSRRTYREPSAHLPPAAVAHDPACDQREAYKTAFDRFVCAREADTSIGNADTPAFDRLWSQACT